ncbi:MAG: sigma-70 family RNA polymerase sigma factor [Planctomycetes bacterium]|nr:sigma-70 family RNA polymerase sigma factor [Planctomycetota bacterium]
MDIAALYDAWASRLLAYMIAVTRDRHLAEDALQNLFVKLATGRPRMDDPAAYLFRAARNEALRVAGRRRETPLAELDLVAPREDAPDSDRSVELARALDRLPPEQVEAVVLHALEGLSFREVGEVLGIPADTVASRYRYALEKLRTWVSP